MGIENVVLRYVPIEEAYDICGKKKKEKKKKKRKDGGLKRQYSNIKRK